MKTPKITALVKQYFTERMQDLPLLIKPIGKEDRFSLFQVTGAKEKAIIATKPMQGVQYGIEVLLWEKL
jgi:hypothetical protein